MCCHSLVRRVEQWGTEPEMKLYQQYSHIGTDPQYCHIKATQW